MFYSLNWLEELVDLKRLSIERLVQTINNYSFEVEDTESIKVAEGKDTVLNVEVGKTDRTDLLSYLGFARELAAITGRKLLVKADFDVPKSGQASLDVKLDKKLCSRYVLAEFEGVEVKPSPVWLRDRLTASGMKPVNNVVDITNYVMLLTGQPVHAFDAERLRGETISVRKAKKNEKLTTLEGETLKLDGSEIVIADKNGPAALAGVMGGTRTRINKQTQKVALEVANFDPVLTRRASWQHNLRTESAHRFEKGLPVEFVDMGLTWAVKFLTEELGAELVGVSDVGKKAHSKSRITLPAGFPSQILDFEVKKNQVEKIFRRLDIEYKKRQDAYSLKPPFTRTDLKRKEDVVEEIGRLIGYEEIPETRPSISSSVQTDPRIWFRRNLKALLRGMGFYEAYNYSFYGESAVAVSGFKPGEHLHLANPLSLEQEYLRRSLLPGLAETTAANLRFFDHAAFFELGNVYLKKQTENFHDQAKLAVSYADKKLKKKQLWKEFYTRIKQLLKNLHIDADFSLKQGENKTVELLQVRLKNGKIIGWMKLAKTGKESVVLAELDEAELFRGDDAERAFTEYSKYPPSTLDLAIIVDTEALWYDIEQTVRANNLVSQVKLFDVYEGKQIPKNKKSLAFSIYFQAKNKTLSDKETKKELDKIIKKLKKRFSVKVRS